MPHCWLVGFFCFFPSIWVVLVALLSPFSGAVLVGAPPSQAECLLADYHPSSPSHVPLNFLQWQPSNCSVDHLHSYVTHSHTRAFPSVMWFCPQPCGEEVTPDWGIALLLLNLLSIQETGFFSTSLVSLLLMQDSSVTFLDSQGSSLVFLCCMLWSCAWF